MKKAKTKSIFTLAFALLVISAKAQISPVNSPYYTDGPFTIVADSVNVPNSKKLVMYRPSTAPAGGQKYPVFLFQPGANGFFSSAINVHTYDIYLKHLATYGYVVGVIDQTAAGLPNGNDFKTTFKWMKTKSRDTQYWLNSYADTTKMFIGGHSNGGVNASALVASGGYPTEVAGIVYFASYPNSTFPVQNVSAYTGYVLDLAGNDDQTTSLANAKGGYDKFTAATCATWVNITGADHGAFGDYVNTNQPVGSIGRTNATATVRHFLVGYLEAYAKGDASAIQQINNTANHPNTITEFISPCALTTAIHNFDNQALTIFPDPANANGFRVGDIVGLDIVKIELFDIYGKNIDTEYVVYENEIRVNTTNLSGGVYFVKLSLPNKVITQKVLIN